MAGRNDSARRTVKTAFRTGFYLDRAKVLKAVDAAKLEAMADAGAWVRKVARRSMRYRKAASAPGSPPSAHPEGPDNPKGPLLRKMLDFAYEPETDSIVVGPVKLGNSRAAALHEKGGRLHRVRRKRRAVGASGPVRILTDRVFGTGELTGMTDAWGFGKSVKVAHKDPKGRLVAFAKLKTAAQVERSFQLEERLYAPLDAMYPARPVMVPALEQSKTKIASFWRDSVKP